MNVNNSPCYIMIFSVIQYRDYMYMYMYMHGGF